MISYLLLRSNKESGPYSLSELVSLGLKPYDLIWIKGKSAAWRYPGEIDELKEYAPAVEEQPYDRFYKKPGEEKKPEPVAPAPKVQPTIAVHAEKKPETTFDPTAYPAYTPKEEPVYTPKEEAAYTPKEDPAYTPKEEAAYTPKEEHAFTPGKSVFVTM